ncbi:MAG: hypothetical protein ACREME_10680 [Gemmatimonadales bacterium]
MRLILTSLLALAMAVPATAQRRARIGPTVSTISIEDASGASQSFTALGGTFALLSGDDGEIGAAVSRYADLSSSSCERNLTFFGVESNYYPVGPRGIAPFASTTLGLARVTDQDAGLLGICSAAEPTSEIGFGFGLGVRVNVGSYVAALVEGRFFQVPNSAIQALEGRANLSVAFGTPRATELLNGTLGPAAGFLIPAGGPLEGRGPVLGVRFRRDTRKTGVLGLEIDYARLRVTDGCTSDCEPTAILFAPAYEPSLHPHWGRLYAGLGLLLAGFPSAGPDRGMAQGAHAGVGADVFTGGPVMWNVNSRLLWLRRNSGENVFLVQLGVSLSPKLERQTGIESR